MEETIAQRPETGRVARLLVTRPAAEAAQWVQVLKSHGWPAQALPLIDIGEPTSADVKAALKAWQQGWQRADALMFVSAAAVSHFFAGDAPARPAQPMNTRFWAPGPGTARQLAQALAGLGITPDHIDSPAEDAAQFDSEHLWPVVASQVRPGSRVLIVRGSSVQAAPGPVAGSGRDWLIGQCEAAGAQVDGCVAYERRPPALKEGDAQRMAEATQAGSVWLFSSSEAVAALRMLQPQAAWNAATALATHPRIAQTVRELGFGRVIESRPSLGDVLRTLELERFTP